MPSMQRGNAASLRSFISEVQQQIYALKNLKQPIDKWDMLLICILTKKLDQYTNRAFHLERDPETLPTLVGLIIFLEKRANAFEENGDKIAHESISKKSFMVTNVATKPSPGKVCKYCNKVDHLLFNCPKFKTAADVVRIKFVDDHKLCTVCLNEHKGHCRFHFKCKICKSGHNTLLHNNNNADQEQTVALHTSSSSKQVLLPTIKVKLFDIRGRELLVRALIDSGSQASFITNSLMKRLSLNPITQPTNIIGIGNKNNLINKYVNIAIHSPVQDVQFNAKCNVVDTITTQLPQQHIDLASFNLPKGIHLSDDKFNVPMEISLLLGCDIYFNILLDGHIKLVNGPVLQNTLFGYVVGGNVSNSHSDNETLVSNFAICDHEKLENVMEQFWLSERIPELPEKENKVTAELQKSENIFQESVQIKDSKFYLDMPLVTDLNNLQLGDSFSVALLRFLALEKKLKHDPNYFKLYKKFINEYLALGHAKIVDISTYDINYGPVYFLPHHAVVNENSKTTKLRVVFNGSMKSKNKLSLNDVMLNGPIVQSELFDILVLFRTYIYTLICDITKMFRAIHINDHQLSLQNILWRDDPSKPISCLQLQTVTYGLKASTYLATRCLIELAQRHGEIYPLAAQAMRFNTYIDDVLSGTDDHNQLCELKRQLVELLSKGSFTLHKWCSNVPEILNDIPSEHKYFEEIDINKDNIIKTLGLKYNIIADQFTFTSPDCDKKDLHSALNVIIRAAQNKYFSSEIHSVSKGKTIKSSLANLHPFLDENNILRVGGRLQNATNMSYDKKHPVIIPKSSRIASMLVEREHLRLLHAGPKLVLSSLLQKYYLISGIREVKKVVHKCVTCHRVKAAAARQLMGSLPRERITAQRPFQTVGIDFCGPFRIKVARIRKPLVSKAYVALFICFVTKAIHVELVTDLSTEAFLASLKRFIARRGLPNCIFCDNATTFKGASNTLKELYDLFSSKIHKDAVINYCVEKCIQFKFIPSYSPEFGGLWEAGVKSLKFHLKRIVGNLCLTYEGLYTVITEIEAILNSRPLLPMSSDISDTNYLTPGHFLIGQAMTSYPELDLTNENVNRLKFWNVLTKLKQDFWKAWSRDYLTQLQSRPKWIEPHPNLKVGDLVIVRSDNTAPLKWPMGRIVKVFPGPDGKVRVAEIRIANKVYTRSYRKLSPLPIN